MKFSKVRYMQKERDPLNLGSLPAVPPPSDGWPAVRAELEKSHNRKRLLRYAGSALAIAATVVLALGVIIRQPAPEAVPAALPGATQVTAQTPDGTQKTLDSLVALSQQLENRVRTIRADVGGMPTHSLVYQVELEDLIAQVDERLSMNPDSLELWSHRVNLLLDLSRLYENQLRRDYRRMASL
ncbi:MAG: hypothetical protein HKN57_00520 [Xanthomonadales bacterium]|nr:hypothetical protein [Gammaproteobacteria bacterium]MBT8052404.1 hypothetical protein [Gammaproteobacteria bacterium]NND55711.1 hypothetical protein [Xanthomonadales bacterium]NNK52271.1 hypothetical protein [Xanthomonadales bacterium]